jgi:hypothetical protein
MNQKRYWLRGGLTGFLIPFISIALFTFTDSINTGDSFWSELGYAYAFMGTPIITITVSLGIILGWLYGKIKNRNK